MLPQRVLTRTKRGGGDGRRLTATVRARCRAVGEELRRHYRCPIPRDDTVRLSVATAPLAHVASAAQSSTADTDISEDGSDRDDEMGHAASLDASGDDACNAPLLVSSVYCGMPLSVVLCTEIWAIFGSFELDVSTFLAVSERRAEVSQQGGERQESSGTVG